MEALAAERVDIRLAVLDMDGDALVFYELETKGVTTMTAIAEGTAQSKWVFPLLKPVECHIILPLGRSHPSSFGYTARYGSSRTRRA